MELFDCQCISHTELASWLWLGRRPIISVWIQIQLMFQPPIKDRALEQHPIRLSSGLSVKGAVHFLGYFVSISVFVLHVFYWPEWLLCCAVKDILGTGVSDNQPALQWMGHSGACGQKQETLKSLASFFNFSFFWACLKCILNSAKFVFLCDVIKKKMPSGIWRRISWNLYYDNKDDDNNDYYF